VDTLQQALQEIQTEGVLMPEIRDQLIALYPDWHWAEVSTSSGWDQILLDLCASIAPHVAELKAAGHDFAVQQVKEKFAGLRFYTSHTSEAINIAIRAAELRAARTCEECGEPGVLRTHRSWMYTSCDQHIRS
jgi:hypothetical protein